MRKRQDKLRKETPDTDQKIIDQYTRTMQTALKDVRDTRIVNDLVFPVVKAWSNTGHQLNKWTRGASVNTWNSSLDIYLRLSHHDSVRGSVDFLEMIEAVLPGFEFTYSSDGSDRRSFVGRYGRCSVTVNMYFKYSSTCTTVKKDRVITESKIVCS